MDSSVADYFDRPVTPIETDDDLKEDSSEFGSLDSDEESSPVMGPRPLVD